MIDANIIAKSHFTRKADGESAFWQFLKEVHLLDEGLNFRVKSSAEHKGQPIWLTATSWGGYFNNDGEWVVFVCWRSSKEGVCQYSHWSWDSDNQMAFNRRDYGFTN